MTKKTSRDIQAQQSKEKILNVALSLIQKFGFDGVSVSQICKETGLSVGAFYHHFPSKADIIIQGYGELDEFFEQSIDEVLKNYSPIEKIVQYAVCIGKYAQTKGLDLVTQVYKAQIDHGNDFFVSEERGISQALKNIVTVAQDQGFLNSDIPSSQITSEILIISRGVIYNWCQSVGNYDVCLTMERLVSNYIQAYII